MNTKFSRRWLMVATLLLPHLVYADALSALGYAEAVLFFVSIFAAFTLGLMAVTYLLPKWRWLHWVQLALFFLSLGVGLLLVRLPSYLDWPLFGRHNPLWKLCLPLGTWLNGVIWARQARRQQVQLFWVVVAVFALQYLLIWGPVEWLTRHSVIDGAFTYSLIFLVVYLVWAFVLGIFSWWVVMRQMRPIQASFLWQPWWRTPTVAAVVSATFAVIYMLLQVLFPERHMAGPFDIWQSMLVILEGVATNWLITLVTLRLISPPVTPPALPDTPRRGGSEGPP